MAITQKSRWDDVGVEPPAGEARYAAGEQPIAEYDNWFNKAVVDDIAALNAWLDNLGITKVYIDAEANKPASGKTTELFIATDTNKIYRGTGTGWQELTVDWNAILNKRVISVSKGLDAVTVTETVLTLKQELVPDEGFYGFAYVEGIRVRAENPTGSGVNLFFVIKVLLDDGSEVGLHDEVLVGEGNVFDDCLRWIYDAIPHGRMIRAVRLYAYCSGLPASGYEPSINIEKVVGVMV